jgi:hypothetical protein
MKRTSIGWATAKRCLLVGLLLACTGAQADAGGPPEQSDTTCAGELKAEVLHNMWNRRPVAKPGRAAAMLRVSYRNDYGHPADALLIAVDGAPMYLRCAAPERRGEVFVGPLAPGVHHVDAVYNFGPGRVGRTPHQLKLKPGSNLSITVVLARDDHEHPTADFETGHGSAVPASPPSAPAPPVSN